MELRSFSHLHFIQAIKGGSVTKVLNVARGQPTLSFREVADIYGCTLLDNGDGKAERSCIGSMEEIRVKIEPDSSVCNANDGDNQRIINLDDDGFDKFTLKQIKERCRKRKRKQSQGLDSSEREIKVEDLSSLEDYRKEQMAADDSDFMETLSSWKSKLSKNMKVKKKKRAKGPISTNTQRTMLVVHYEEIQKDQECAPSGGDSAALVEVKLEVPDTDCLDRQDAYFDIEGTEETEITYEWNLENEFNYEWKEHNAFIPLRMVMPSSMDIVISNSQLSSDQSPNFPAIEFESEECVIHQDSSSISPQLITLDEDDNSDTDNQPDGDTDSPLSLHSVDTHTILDSSKDEFTTDAEDQAKPNSTIENSSNPDDCPVCLSDDSPEYEKQPSSVDDDEKSHVKEANDELTSWDERSSKPHRPERLLSNRKAISPSSQEKLCKAMESIDINYKNNLKCRGKLNFTEQTDKKNGTAEAEGLGDITGAGLTENRNKIGIIPKTYKRGSLPKANSKIPHSARPSTRIGCNTVQSCSKNAIAFSKQQMHDAECLAMKLTKELKSMKDIVDDMLRSEFCLNTSLRHKVNEARMAVKNAARAEEVAKRCLSFMARDCNRFCKIMKLTEDGPSTPPPPPPPQDVVRKERKKIAFADEAGGKLCQVRFYENEEASLSESN